MILNEMKNAEIKMTFERVDELQLNSCDCDDCEWNEECENRNDDFDDKDEKCDARVWKWNESDVRWLTESCQKIVDEWEKYFLLLLLREKIEIYSIMLDKKIEMNEIEMKKIEMKRIEMKKIEMKKIKMKKIVTMKDVNIIV